MGCEAEGETSPLGFSIIPALATGVVQYLIADRMLDAAKEARLKMEALAEEMLVLAEELHASHMEMRARDNEVYDYLKALPSYEICSTNIERGELSGKFLAGQLAKQNAFGYSRYNVGNRKQAIQDAINAAIISAGEQSAEAWNFEEAVQDAYDSLKRGAISSATAFESQVTGVFGNVARSFQQQSQMFDRSANASIAGVGYSLVNIVNAGRREVSNARLRSASSDVDSFMSSNNDLFGFGNTTAPTTAFSNQGF